ncbi:MAG: hypothetical protein JEZ02_21975, partial [Desulfatibacillum sp.]|nr:hypothetical protein [Desulfatibacillum sp.]
MRSFSESFDEERAKRGTAPINLVDFNFTSPVLVSDRDLSIPVSGITPVEADFTEFAEVDNHSQLQGITSDFIGVSGLGMGYAAYLYRDMEAPLFGRSDFVHTASFKVSSGGTSGGSMCVWGVGDGIGPLDALSKYMHVCVTHAGASSLTIYLKANDGSFPYITSYNYLATDSYYFLTIGYNAGTKALTCAIYSDASRTTLVTTLSVTLYNSVALQYIYAVSSLSSDLYWISGEIGPLSIDSGYIDITGLVTDWSYVDSATDTARDLVPPITAPDLELTLANTGATPFSSLFD